MNQIIISQEEDLKGIEVDSRRITIKIQIEDAITSDIIIINIRNKLKF